MNEQNAPQLPRGFTPPQEMTDMAEGERVLLALSGGADSAALLDMLCRAGCEVECAHLNHMIRGAAADRDEAFCKALAESRKLEFHSARIDVLLSAREHGEGLEAAARRERYAFLERVMCERKIRILITAHNADDNLETMLLRLARGCGARGMCGIPPMRPLSDGRMVLRPMLGVTKAEVNAYCRERGIAHVTDETNGDIDYARNRVRARVLPELWAINPAASAAAARLGAEMREDCEYLDEEARRFAREQLTLYGDSEHGGRGVPTAALAALPRPIAVRVIRQLYDDEVKGAMLEGRHISLLLSLISDAADAKNEDTSVPRRLMSLPGGATAMVRGGLFTISRADDHQECFDILPSGIYPLEPGETRLPGGFSVILAENGWEDGENGKNINIIYKVATKAHLSADKIKGTLFARPRRAGDRILMCGMHKSVKKLLCDHGVPTADRARLPIICDDDGIAFIPFVGVRDDLRVGRGYGGRCISICIVTRQDDVAGDRYPHRQ